MNILQSKELREAATEAAFQFKQRHRGEDWMQLFVERKAESEFAAIGLAAFEKRSKPKHDLHIYTWTGYEIVMDNPQY